MRRTVVALLAVVLAGCGAAPERPVPAVAATTAPVRVQPVAAAQKGSHPIPWIDTVAPAYVPPKPLPMKPLTRKAPPCTAHQLHVASAPTSSRSQELDVVLALTNVSRRPCLLFGTPAVTLSGGHGRPPVITPEPMEGTSYDMETGQATLLELRAFVLCTDGKSSVDVPGTDRVTIAMRDGSAVSVSGVRLPGACGGIGESNYYRFTPEPKYAPLPLSGAKFFLETPSTPARAGRPYVYVLVVRNPTTKPITMSPCPAYQQWLSVGTNTTPDLLLDCGGRRSLAAGAVLRFAMHVRIPTDTPTGPALLAWGLRDSVFKDEIRRTIQVVGNDIPCRAGQLTASSPDAAVPFDHTGIYDFKDAGTSLTVTVTNTSSTLCTLQGAPTVALIGNTGQGLGLRWTDRSPSRNLPMPVWMALSPGSSATTVLSWHTQWCGPDPNPVTVTLGLPGAFGGSVRFKPAEGWAPPPCKGWKFPLNVSSTQFG